MALYTDIWTWSGGYAYLHRNVPIYMLTEESDVEKLAPTFNAVVTYEPLPETRDCFERVQCWDSMSYQHLPVRVCLYKRPGGCAPRGPGL